MCRKNVVVSDLLLLMSGVTVSVYMDNVFRFRCYFTDVPGYLFSKVVERVVPINDDLQLWVKS